MLYLKAVLRILKFKYFKKQINLTLKFSFDFRHQLTKAVYNWQPSWFSILLDVMAETSDLDRQFLKMKHRVKTATKKTTNSLTPTLAYKKRRALNMITNYTIQKRKCVASGEKAKQTSPKISSDKIDYKNLTVEELKEMKKNNKLFP